MVNTGWRDYGSLQTLDVYKRQVVWSWDKETGVCSVRMPDKGGNEQIMIAFK